MVSGTKFKKNPRTWSILHYIPKTGERKEKSPKSRSWPEERSSRVRHLWGYIRPQESVFTFEVILLQHSTPPWHICSIGSRLAFLVPIMDVIAPAYDEPNFSEITTEKLTHYKVIWQKCSDILKKELQYDEAALTQVCDYGLEKLSADNPVFPPSPFTIENVYAFYKSCDKICDADLKEISHCPPECACTKSPPLPLLEFNSSPVNCFHGFQIKIRQQRSRGTACNRRK